MSNIPQRYKLEFYKKLQKKLQLVIVGDLNLYDWNSEIRDKIESLEIELNEPEENKEGALHWYQMRFIYRRKGSNVPSFEQNLQVGVSEQKEILNFRALKKNNKPLHQQDNGSSIRGCLNNGTLVVEIKCYIGYFSKE